MILQWLTSPEWANVVKALLHTLWQGAVIAALLGFALRRLDNPVARYRCSLAALGGVMLAGLVTWAVLNRPLPQSVSHASALPTQQPASVPVANNNLPPLVVNFSPHESKPAAMPWSAWLAMFWLAGATAMIFRAGFQVAGAGRLRRSSRPLDDAHIAGLLDDARRAVGLARRVRIAVTDKLTSPAVVGVLVPVLILPLSLTTTLTPEQIRFVLLHELAHIRRGDYFAGLFQLFAEALLFFNPAVWWISRQMRIEREACCDALAIELSGAPADYARTLVRVAENVLSNAPLAAPAFGDRREPSSLADRVQRMLVPGYRPALRLTWRAMLVALFVGGGLLFLSALGTRVTVAAILSPQERIERIEKKMAEYGKTPETENVKGVVKISGRLLMADGTPAPKRVYLNACSTVQNASTFLPVFARNGFFTNNTIPAGTIYLGVEMTNCAPAFIGPLDGFATNQFENLDIVCEPGFDVSLQPVDAETGKPVMDAKASTIFWMNNNGFQYHFWKSGVDGSIALAHCADLPMDAIVNAPGYEIVQQRFDHVRPGEVLRMELRRGEITTGTVVDKVTGEVLAGATLRLVYEKGRTEAYHQWTDEMRLLARTDADGRFSLNQLASGTKYWIGVSAPGHESVAVNSLTAGAKDAVIKLGPELVVRGRVIGNLDSLQKNYNAPALYWSFNEAYGNNSYGDGGWLPLRVDESGVASFEFTNRIAARVTLTGGNYSESREVTAPIADWVVDLKGTNKTAAKLVPKREVVFRFLHPSGVPPAGTVEVTVPDSLDPNHLTAHLREMAITNNEVHAQIAIGGRTSIEPKRMIGYWFDRFGENGSLLSILVTNGTGPLVIEIPLVPAGAIFARAKNADGTPAGGLLFTVEELKRSPLRDENYPLTDGSDGVSDNAPRKWASGPLPLGGTYQIIAWRGNSFCASQPVKLTDAQPDAEVELQFPPGQSFTGEVRDADGQPVRNCDLGVEFIGGNSHSFGLKSVLTDEQGRFRVDDVTPGIGKYTVIVSSPGCRAEMFDVNFSRLPMVLRLQRGRTLAGRVVEAGTGYVIPDAEVRAWTDGGNLPQQTVRTDADGRFEFTTLGDGTYHVFVDGANFGMNANNEFKTGQTNLLLKVTPYQGSQLAPKAPTAKTSSTKVGTAASVSSNAYSFKETTNVEQTVQAAKPVPTQLGRQKIIEKLNRIRLPQVSFDHLSLKEVVRQLQEQSKLRDPEHKGINFLIDPIPDEFGPVIAAPSGGGFGGGIFGALAAPAQIDPKTGLPIAAAAAAGGNETIDIANADTVNLQFNDVRLADVLDDIVTNADHPDGHPLKYSIEDFGVVFSDKVQEPPPLFIRTFKVDPHTFYSGLKSASSSTFSSTNSEAARAFFTALGVNLASPPGKAIFYNDGTGILLVRATAEDLNTITRAIQVLNEVPPQLQIKARFLEVPKGTYQNLVVPNLFTNAPINVLKSATNIRPEILTEEKFKTVLRALAAKPGIVSLGEPSGTTISGRQMQMRATEIITAVTNLAWQQTWVTNRGNVMVSNSIVPQTTQIETGPVLDVVPYVLSDGYTINLALIPSLTEFLGYDKPTKSQKVLPRFAVRQVVTTLNLWDGQTVVLEMSESNSVVGGKFPDKKPNVQDKELLVFITATIVDPAGNRVHSDDELPFTKDGIPPQPPQSAR